MKTISRYIMTLALLLTAVTGAWAQDTYNVTFKANGNTKTVENITLPKTFSCNWDDETLGTDELDLIIQELYGLSGGYCASIAPNSDNVSVTCALNGGNQSITISGPFNGTATVTGRYDDSNNNGFDYTLEITCVDPNAEPAIDVKWDAATKTGTFTMPAFDVEIAPIYAPVAQWAKVEDEDQLPTAIEGIFAESTDAIVKAGTVAKIGDTENLQGTLMYAVSTSATEAPALTAFSATLPTAKDITTAGDVYVWYYIKGADTPEGQEATAENTFNDSEICATPLTVTVLNNKFDIQFKAANDNTIEAGKATVTVGGTAATVTEGKLESVKMGTEVKVKAKDGYKFRKVEVKKKAANVHSITIAVDPRTTEPKATAPAMTIEFNTGETWADVAARYDWLDTYETYTVFYKGNNLTGDVHDANGGVTPDKTIDPNGSYHWEI